jgi:hypothetical protein
MPLQDADGTRTQRRYSYSIDYNRAGQLVVIFVANRPLDS